MPKPSRARLPGNADLYADPKARADELLGPGPAAETAGLLGEMWRASLEPFGKAWDAVAPAIGEAITDARKKLEEFFWGREISSKEIDITREPPGAETRMGFRELIAMQAAMLGNTPERAEPARHEPEIDGPSM